MNGRLRVLIDSFAETHRLSQRERSVLQLAASGAVVKEIAVQLSCSPRTIEEYWQRMFAKIGCRSRGEVLAQLLDFATMGPEIDAENPAGSALPTAD
jgi:DNA-binding CsgD family transcriptional regulator